MKTRLATLVLALCFALDARGDCSAPPVLSNFSASDEGWSHDGASVFGYHAVGGNPTGYLYIDNSEGPITYIFAPLKFRGDLRGCDGGTVSFDGNMLGNGGGGYFNANADYGNLYIFGAPGTGFGRADLVPGPAPGNQPPLGSWRHYEIPFTAAQFNVTQTQWTNILANAVTVQMSVEALFGAEIEGIDNFKISATPYVAPPTIPALPAYWSFGLAAALVGVVAAAVVSRRSRVTQGS